MRGTPGKAQRFPGARRVFGTRGGATAFYLLSKRMM